MSTPEERVGGHVVGSDTREVVALRIRSFRVSEWLAAITVVLAILGMAFAAPPLVGPDETPHQATASYLTVHIMPPIAETQAYVPGLLKFGDCTSFDSTKDESCLPPREEALSGFGRIFNYPPLYYWAVGLGQKAAPGADLWLDVGGRVASTLITLIVLIALALSARVRFPLWGSSLLAVTTPMAVFLWAVVNPNGWEISCGLLFAYALLVAWKPTQDVKTPRIPWWAQSIVVGVVAIIFGLSRHDALIWIILLTAAVYFMSTSRSLDRRRLTLLLAAALGVVAGLVWQWTHPALHPLHNPDYNANPTLLDRVHWFMQIDNVLPDHVRQMVGVLGSLDTPVPQILVVTFTLGWAATGGLLYARQKVSALVVMIGFFGIFLLPWVLEFLRWNDWPYWWEGRYALPFAIPFLFIFLLRYGAKGSRAVQALSLVSSFILLFMVWQTFMRYAYGVKDYIPVRWDNPAVGPVPYFGSIIIITLMSSLLVVRLIIFFSQALRERRALQGVETS
ncbi:MAG: DUF2142 domain-containing protein [Actinomycetes bacterium]